MTYVVTDNCIKCKYMDCIEVCPVDCFYEGENSSSSTRRMHRLRRLRSRIPAEAIKPDTEPGHEKWLRINTRIRLRMAEHHGQEGTARRRQGVRRRRRQVREVFLGGARRRRLRRAGAFRHLSRAIAVCDKAPLAMPSIATCPRTALRGCGKLLILSPFCDRVLSHADDNPSIHGVRAIITERREIFWGPGSLGPDIPLESPPPVPSPPVVIARAEPERPALSGPKQE